MLFGTPEDPTKPNPGLLGGNQEPQTMFGGTLNSQDLLNFGIGVLSNSTESTGVGLGNGLKYMQAGQQQRQNNQRSNQKLRMEQAEYKQKISKLEKQKANAARFGNLLGTPANLNPSIPLRRTEGTGFLGGKIPQRQMNVEMAKMFAEQGDFKSAYAAAQPQKVDQTTLVKNLMAAGVNPGTPEFRNAILENVNKPATQINMGDGNSYKLEPGYMMKDPKTPSLGVQPIPGGSKDTMTPEAAGKASMMISAEKKLDTVNSLFMNPDGSMNNKNILTANIPFTDGLPWTDGRQAIAAMEQGIQAITRSETGAAMPDTEVDNTRKRFQPKPWDNPVTQRMKLQMFNGFVRGTIKLIDPSGRFDSKRFEVELDKRLGRERSPKEILIESQADEAIRQGADPDAVAERVRQIRGF